jgi:serine/threonine-protein kinase
MKRCPICRTTYPGQQAQFCPADGSVLETVAERIDPLVGTTLEGKYRIESRIGAGGMGAVYKAHHLMLGRDVAVKVLRSEMLADARAAERFRREAQAAARIDHPNAVTIYDFGISADGNAYLVMELLRGTSLRDVLDRDGALALDRALEIFTPVCAGIDRAHQLGIIHRDIKPDNIMVDERPGGSTAVKVVDFGIAMLQDMLASGSSRLTGTGVVVGTANYMSPEHCRGAEVDARSDIYSLGVVLYEMLTGRVPFAASAPSAIIVAHVNEAPAPPRTLRPDLPPAVERVVLDALAKRPEERPQTAAELARRLVAARTGVSTNDATVPISAHPPRTATAPVQGVDTAGRTQHATVATPMPATLPTVPAAAYGAAPAGSRRELSPMAVGVVVVAMLAIGAAIAAASFGVINMRSAANANAANAAPPPAPQPNVAAPPKIPPIAPAPPAPDPSTGPQPLSQDQEREVEQFLSDWLASSQARDIEWHLRHYADVVDYYDAGPVPRIRVRADRTRAYEKFDQIEIRIPTVREATADPAGREFRLVLDKQWRFSGPEGTSTGKVKQLLVLRRIGSDLKIVAEKDLAVY